MDTAGVIVGVLQGLKDGGGDLSGVVLRVGGEARDRVEDCAPVEELLWKGRGGGGVTPWWLFGNKLPIQYGNLGDDESFTALDQPL